MESKASLERKYRRLQRQIRPLPNVSLNLESLKSAEIQAFFARGDRRSARTLPLLAEGSSLRKACREVDLDQAFYITRERKETEMFPWEVLDQGIVRNYLWREYRLALEAKSGQGCYPGCRRCGICTA
jgi:hypothetical protein